MDENAQCPMPNFVAPAACAAFSTASCCTFGKEGFIDTPELVVYRLYRSIEGMGNSSTLQKTIAHELGVMARFLQRDICESIEEHLRTEITKFYTFVKLNTVGHRTVVSRLKPTVSTVSTVSTEPHPVSHRSVWKASHSSPWLSWNATFIWRPSAWPSYMGLVGLVVYGHPMSSPMIFPSIGLIQCRVPSACL